VRVDHGTVEAFVEDVVAKRGCIVDAERVLVEKAGARPDGGDGAGTLGPGDGAELAALVEAEVVGGIGGDARRVENTGGREGVAGTPLEDALAGGEIEIAEG